MGEPSPMTRPGDHAELLGELINERRLELGLTWDQVTERTGVAASAIREVRKGRATLRDITAAKIERGLGLAPRSIHRLMTGQTTRLALAGEPPPAPASELPAVVAANLGDQVVLDVWESGLSVDGKLELITRYLEHRDGETSPAASSHP